MALLELGPSLVSDISKKAGINRTTSYDILERLAIYGVVSYVSGQGTKKKYCAESPNKLMTFFENKSRSYERRLNELKKKMPQLEMFYKNWQIDRPVIRFFEGTEGFKAIYSETLKSKEEILSILGIKTLDPVSYTHLRAHET